MAERGPSLKLVLTSPTDISERPLNRENPAKNCGANASKLSRSAKLLTRTGHRLFQIIVEKSAVFASPFLE